MDLIKCLIKNLRVAEDPTATRLIKFTKADETSNFLIPPVIPSIATNSTGFNLCLAPVILPGFCDNAINHVGFDYNRRINGITFELKNRITDELIASGSAEDYWNVIDAINTSSIVSARGIEGNDGTPEIVLQNISSEDLQLLLTFFTGNSEINSEVYQNYQGYYNNVDENPTYNQIDDNSFEVCLLASACVTETKTIQFKTPGIDITSKNMVIKYTIESQGITNTVTDTLVYSGDYNDASSSFYNVDHTDTITQRLRNRFEEYSNIRSVIIDSDPIESGILLNNCIENRGDVEFSLKFNWSRTPTNIIELILSEDSGASLIRVTTEGPLPNEQVLTNLANGLAPYGYTIKTPAANNLIVIAKSDVKSLSVVTSEYPNYSYTVNGSNWGYDGYFSVDGVFRANVVVRPGSCTIGLKDPNRNFSNTSVVFKGYPLKGSVPMNYTKVTIDKVTDLGSNDIDFLTTLTDLDTFSFETCETNIREFE